MLTKHLSGVQPEVCAGLPKKHSIDRSIRRERLTPIDPKKTTDFQEIEERYRITDFGEIFLQHDSGHEDVGRFLFFSTVSLHTLLSAALTIFWDGTFKMAPECFAQVYVIRLMSEGVYVTVLYGLLPNKKRQLKNAFSSV